MGQFSILGWHLARSLAFLPLPIPVPLPQAERQPDPWGTHGWEGEGCRVQAGPVEGRCTAPRPHFPPPSIFRSIIVHSWVYFFPHSFPRKTDRIPPGKAISPSPELVRGSPHTAK